MIKLVYCITKRDDVSAEDFYHSWLEDHGTLVKSFAEAMGAVKYVQSHTILPDVNARFIASRGLEQPYDGITEFWWNSVEEMKASGATPEGRAASKTLIEDEARMIDFSRCRVFMTEEHEIF